MSEKWKKRIPNILIGIGVVCILGFAIHEGIQYPWQALFASWGWIELPEELPDPNPLPADALNPDIDATLSSSLAEVPGMFASRPQMNLTKLGVIKIPRIQISENIVEGVGDEMYYAVGHYPGSAMPGEKGNCFLAAHRVYVYMRPFRHLDKMKIGDYVYISDDTNTYTYEVFKLFEIEADENWILQPQEEEDYLLTLLTCTPIPSFTHRLICWAKLVDTVPNS
jgi:Sortase (surface protein transpeptidase)